MGFWETGKWVWVWILVFGGRGFDSTTFCFFGGVVALSPYLFGGVVGLSPHLWGWGDFFLILFCLGGGGFTLIS